MCVPGRNFPCLCGFRSTVKLDQVGADAAEVQQGVPLAGRAVADDALALSPQPDQKLEQAPLHLVHARREAPVRLELGVSRGPLARRAARATLARRSWVASLAWVT